MSGRPKTIIFIVIAAFLVVVAAKAVTGGPTAATSEAPAGAPSSAGSAAGGAAGDTGETITSTHNDAVADYEAALASGKPIYVLFHSLTCEPCVEISAVVDQVMPAYEGKVVFVNAITDDASAKELAAKFSFQYIPTSFFLEPDGTVADSFTGAMDETQLRGFLDALAGAK